MVLSPLAGTVPDGAVGVAQTGAGSRWCDLGSLGAGALAQKDEERFLTQLYSLGFKALGFQSVLLKCRCPFREILNLKTQNLGSEELKGSCSVKTFHRA